MRINKYIAGFMATSLLMLASSCHDDTFSDFADDGSDVYTVTINVGLEGMETSTRDEDSDPPAPPAMRYIGDGSKIDMLVYAVYYDAAPDKDEPDHKPDWQAATEYAKGVVKEFEDHKEIQAGHGQTILDVSTTLQKGNGTKQPITLTLKKGEKYQVVFWAQNHNTEAFVIDDLKRVQMKYKVLHDEKDDQGNASDIIKSVNNDEARDAFCRSVSLDGNEAKRNLTIYLRRPLAQINVGTQGFDYESITRNTHKDGEYLYSKIRINRAARYLNVVTDEIYTTTTENNEYLESTEAFYTIDYEYNKFPAFWKYEDKNDEIGKTPYPSYSIYDLEYPELYDPDLNSYGRPNPSGAYNSFVESHSDEFKGLKTDDEKRKKYRELYDKEEFLRVRLFDHTDEDRMKYGTRKIKDDNQVSYEDDFYIPYECMGNAMDIDEGVQNRSEVFKYLSMCYILTNSGDDYQDVLTNVKMWIAKDKNGKDEVEVINLNNVPVKRNHRTNIVGSLLTAKANMQIIVDQDFAGRKIHGDDNLQSGEIAEGFYYDAEKNEFQISSVNGLLFFQQLVNGDLTVRQLTSTANGVTLRGPYPYKTYGGEDDNIYWLKYKSWKYEDLGEKKAKMLLSALNMNKESFTKQDNSTSVKNSYKYYRDLTDEYGKKYTISLWLDATTGWPVFNNFSFHGATVKLMADIDLSGVEWIPIGFDCCNWDSSIRYTDNSAYSAVEEINSTNYRILYKGGKIFFEHRRVFAGTFDGNGHTIYNMSTKKFGSEVLEYNQQKIKKTFLGEGPYDNIQWFGRGFFGLCGPGVVIKNLRLQNVDVHGNNGVAALVAVVNSAGLKAQIDNCIVDGGTITATPLYRYDQDDSKYKGRTHARGVYVSGIVGQFCALGDEAGVTNCEVRNLVIQGFRRMGAIIGSIADQGKDESMGISDMQLNLKVKDNKVSNTLIVCNQYVPFDYVWNEINSGIWKNGFGWGTANNTSPMSDIILGGNLDNFDAFSQGYHKGTEYPANKKEYYDNIPLNNSVSNVQYSILSVRPNENENSILTNKPKDTIRESEIGNIPLEYIPMFSSLFVDEVILTNNYYGQAQLKTKIDFIDNAKLWTGNDGKNNYFKFPIVFPNGIGINYGHQSKSMAGMYVETVYISGENAPGGRSVITPTGVDGEKSCVMYVTARDRKQFENKLNGKESSSGYTLPSETTVKHVVLRGSPYAWAGIILAPNENMSEVNLDNVTIYDVYRTLSLQEEGDVIQNYTNWTGASVVLNVKNSNLRGYTVPGGGWNQINYNKTTFEQGSETRYSYDTMGDEHSNEYKTCDVEATTVFTDCFFKAPYYINLRPLRERNKEITNSDAKLTVKFSKDDGSAKCYGTSAYNNVEIKLPAGKEDLVYYIAIEKDTERGQTIVKYYGADQKEIK